MKTISTYLSDFFYKKMKTCEHISGESELIKSLEDEIDEELRIGEQAQKELEFKDENLITKEDQIYNLHCFIELLASNFRAENYEEMDNLFRKINL